MTYLLKYFLFRFWLINMQSPFCIINMNAWHLMELVTGGSSAYTTDVNRKLWWHVTTACTAFTEGEACHYCCFEWTLCISENQNVLPVSAQSQRKISAFIRLRLSITQTWAACQPQSGKMKTQHKAEAECLFYTTVDVCLDYKQRFKLQL